MIKKISALILALVLCLSVMVVPASAYDLGSSSEIAYVVELDKDSYNAGETVTINLYLYGKSGLEFGTGAIIFGCNSAVFDKAENANDDVKASAVGSELNESYYKAANGSTWAWQTNATVLTNITNGNTADENAMFDQYMKYTIARNTSGTHDNAGSNKNGLPADEINADSENGVAFVSFQLKLRDDIADGTVINVGIPSGAMPKNYCYMNYYKDPGNLTTVVKTTAATSEVVFDTDSKIGVEPCETHAWNEGEQTTAPTCGEAGEMLYTCTVCKSTKTEAIEATGNHTAGDPVDENVVAPSCNAAGSKEVVVNCSECGAEMSRTTETIPATGDHNYATKKVVAEATCTEAGSYVMVCGCGAEDAPVAIPATGHDMQETTPAVDPTCTEVGYTAVLTCANGCGTTEGGAEVAVTGHNMVAGEVVAPTCTTAGYTVYTCANNCGTTENRDVVAAIDHAYEAVVTAPTCTTAGYTTYTCPACGDTYTADEVEATDHNYESEVLRTATCTRTGVIKYTCSACGDNYREDIPSIDHKNADGSPATVVVPGKPATCTSTGLTEGEKCTICQNMTVVQQTIPTTDHGKDNPVVTEPTYSSQGYTTYTCNACGAEYKDDYVPALSVEFTFEIAEPSVTTLRARDSLVLHPVFTGEVADGVTVVWTADNNKFKTKELDDGSLEINARKNGTTVFTATVYDAEGNEITSDTVEIVSNAKFFGQIVGFFRAIFGLAKYYEN